MCVPKSGARRQEWCAKVVRQSVICWCPGWIQPSGTHCTASNLSAPSHLTLALPHRRVVVTWTVDTVILQPPTNPRWDLILAARVFPLLLNLSTADFVSVLIFETYAIGRSCTASSPRSVHRCDHDHERPYRSWSAWVSGHTARFLPPSPLILIASFLLQKPSGPFWPSSAATHKRCKSSSWHRHKTDNRCSKLNLRVTSMSLCPDVLDRLPPLTSTFIPTGSRPSTTLETILMLFPRQSSPPMASTRETCLVRLAHRIIPTCPFVSFALSSPSQLQLSLV